MGNRAIAVRISRAQLEIYVGWDLIIHRSESNAARICRGAPVRPFVERTSASSSADAATLPWDLRCDIHSSLFRGCHNALRRLLRSYRPSSVSSSFGKWAVSARVLPFSMCAGHSKIISCSYRPRFNRASTEPSNMEVSDKEAAELLMPSSSPSSELVVGGRHRFWASENGGPGQSFSGEVLLPEMRYPTTSSGASYWLSECQVLVFGRVVYGARPWCGGYFD